MVPGYFCQRFCHPRYLTAAGLHRFRCACARASGRLLVGFCAELVRYGPCNMRKMDVSRSSASPVSFREAHTHPASPGHSISCETWISPFGCLTSSVIGRRPGTTGTQAWERQSCKIFALSPSALATLPFRATRPANRPVRVRNFSNFVSAYSSQDINGPRQHAPSSLLPAFLFPAPL